MITLLLLAVWGCKGTDGRFCDENPYDSGCQVIETDETDDDYDGDGYTEGDGDCDDNNTEINPDVEELISDGIDQNCDGRELCYQDEDEDSYGGEETTYGEDLTCSSAGLSPTNDGDCNDTDNSIAPSKTEVCGDWIDQDCDGTEDNGCDFQTVGCSKSEFSSIKYGVQWLQNNGYDSVYVCAGSYYEEEIGIWQDFELQTEQENGGVHIYVDDDNAGIGFGPQKSTDSFAYITIEPLEIHCSTNDTGSGISLTQFSEAAANIDIYDIRISNCQAAITTPYGGLPSGLDINFYGGSASENKLGMSVWGSNIDFRFEDFMFDQNTGSGVFDVSTDSRDGDYPGNMSITLINSILSKNTNESAGSVLSLQCITDDPFEFVLQNTDVFDNVSNTSPNFGASGAFYIGADCDSTSIRMSGGSVVHNEALNDGETGGATLYAGTMSVSNTDWGMGADDNTPADIGRGYSTNFNYDGVSSFECVSNGFVSCD